MKGYTLSACLFFAKINMQTLKGMEKWKEFLHKRNFHLHLFSIIPNCPEDTEECCMFKGFQHFRVNADTIGEDFHSNSIKER